MKDDTPRPRKDERVTPLGGNHQPIVVPIDNALVSKAVDTIASLVKPEPGKAGQKIRIAVPLSVTSIGPNSVKYFGH